MPKNDPDETTPEPKKEKEQLVSKAKLDEKEAELQSLRATLKALEGHQVPQQPQSLPPGSSQIAQFSKIIADEMQWDQKAVMENLTLIDRYASTYAQQTIFPILNGLADRIDGIEARTQYPDFTKYESEIETERKQRADRGLYLSRSEAYHLVRGRNLPKILEEEKERAAAERTPIPTDDSAHSTQKAGPTGGPSRLPSRDELASMTPEQRKELAQNMSF